MQEPSIFTRIYNGEIPGEIIYKDDLCFALLNIQPLSPGHTLVIPIQQTDRLWDIGEPLYSHLFEVARKVARAIDETHDYRRIDMLVEGIEVAHAHIHLFGLGPDQSMSGFTEKPRQATVEELKTEADKLRACL